MDRSVNAVLWSPAALRLVALLLLALAPPSIALHLIDRNGVNVPYGDDFAFAPLYASAMAHKLSLADLYQQHNEHRLFLPRLFAIVLAKFFHGDLRAEMMLSWLLCGLTALGVLALIRRTIGGSWNGSVFVMFLINLVLFSPVQAENWMWGFQFAVFLNNLLLVISVLLAMSALPLGLKFGATASLAACATFSVANGALLWLLSFPLALLQSHSSKSSKRLLWAIAWAALGVLTVGAYFVGYTKPPEIPHVKASQRLVDYAVYLLLFVGGHLSRSSTTRLLLSCAEGAALLLLFFGSAVYVLRHRRGAALRDKALPWFALGLYAVLTGALAAVSRIGFGTAQALSSRYTTYALYLSVAVIGLFALIVARDRATPPLRPRLYVGGAIVAVVLAVLSNSYRWGTQMIEQMHTERLEGKAALLVVNILDSGAVCETRLNANAYDARRLGNMLNGLGLLRPAMLTSARVSSLSNVESRQLIAGYVEGVHERAAEYEANGWAMLSNLRPADAVLLSRGGSASDQTLFVIATKQQRADLVRSFQSPRMIMAGWRATFSRVAPTNSREQITAWAFDASRATLHELRNRFQLP